MKKFIGQYRFCDLLTMCGCLAAILGVSLSLGEHYHFAIILMIICAFCDTFDGYFSRKRKNSEFESTYGSELDSLSDIICFGVFPAVFIFKSNELSIIKYIVPIYVLAGLIRLAYFNTLNITKTNEKGYFKGVPITTIAFILPVIYLSIFFSKNVYDFLTLIVMMCLSILFITNIKIKKPDINNILNYFSNTHYSKLVRIIINLLIFPIFLILISDLFFKLNGFHGFALFDIFKSIYNYPLAFIFILIIFIILMLIFTGLCKSTSRAKFTLMIIAAIFLTINDVKFTIMNNPVMLSDINYLNTSNIGTAGEYLNVVLGFWIIQVVVKLSVMIFIALLIKESKLSETKLNTKTRLGFIFIPIVCLSIIVGNSIKHSNFMIKNIYRYNFDKLLRIENFGFVYYEEGFYQGIMFNKYSSDVFKPKTYNRKDAKYLLKNTKIEEDDWGSPNIVIILSESFSDLTNVTDITFNEDLLSNIHELDKKDDVIVTNTYVSTYGGQSVMSEFEVQTSASNQFFIPSYIAFNEYYHDKHNKRIDASPHIIHSLDSYISKYITPWQGGSYNSKFVYNTLGIDETHYNLEGEIKGLYLADSEITKSIVNELKEDSSKPKLLIYATGEGHMPCFEDKFDKYDVSVKESSLNEEDTSLIKCYAQGVFDADKELGNLYKEIKKIDKDTIVIFFGDHHPYITNKNGKNIYANLSYFNTDDENLNNLRQYTTKSVIFSNYIDKLDKSINYINLSYLGAYVYSHLNIKDKDYYNFVNNTRKEMPVFSRHFVYDINTKRFIDIDKLDKNYKKLYNNLRNVQYYEFFDKK